MLKKIKPEALKVGHYLVEVYGSNFAETGLKKSGKLAQQRAVDVLLKLKPDFIVVDTSKGLDAHQHELYHFASQSMPSTGKKNWPKNNKSVTEEIARANKLVNEAKSFIANMLEAVKQGGTIDLETGQTHSTHIIESVADNDSALLCLSRIRQKDSYLLEHSVHVATLCAVFCKFLGIDDDTTTRYVTGAMFHDIGKVYVPDHILHKPSKLNEEEWQIMREHPAHSHSLLVEIDDIHPDIVAIGLQHHERVDGAGYPKGLMADAINYGSKITSLCDVYDALTAHRCYKDGMNPAKAMKLILSWQNSHFDHKLTQQFIHCLGVYPVGSFVELSNGLGAIVIEACEDFRKPNVLCVWDFNKNQALIPTFEMLSKTDASIEKLADEHLLGKDLGHLIRGFTQSVS